MNNTIDLMTPKGKAANCSYMVMETVEAEGYKKSFIDIEELQKDAHESVEPNTKVVLKRDISIHGSVSKYNAIIIEKGTELTIKSVRLAEPPSSILPGDGFFIEKDEGIVYEILSKERVRRGLLVHSLCKITKGEEEEGWLWNKRVLKTRVEEEWRYIPDIYEADIKIGEHTKAPDVELAGDWLDFK